MLILSFALQGFIAAKSVWHLSDLARSTAGHHEFVRLKCRLPMCIARDYGLECWMQARERAFKAIAVLECQMFNLFNQHLQSLF